MSLEQWKRHFKDMAEGRSKPDKNGLWWLKEYTEDAPTTSTPVKVVSNTQQHVEQAKAKKRKQTQNVQMQNKRQKVSSELTEKSIKAKPKPTTSHNAVGRRAVKSNYKALNKKASLKAFKLISQRKVNPSLKKRKRIYD